MISAAGSRSRTGRCSATMTNSTRTSSPTARFSRPLRRCPSGSSSPATIIATIAETCSARPILSGRTGSAGIDQTMLFGFEVGREKSRNFRMTGYDLRRRNSGRRLGAADRSNCRDETVVFAPIASDANNRVKATVAAAICPGSDPAGVMARDRRRDPLRQLQDRRRRSSPDRRRRVRPPRQSVVAAARPDPEADSTICRSTPATAGPTCRSRATSSAA